MVQISLTEQQIREDILRQLSETHSAGRLSRPLSREIQRQISRATSVDSTGSQVTRRLGLLEEFLKFVEVFCVYFPYTQNLSFRMVFEITGNTARLIHHPWVYLDWI